MCIMSKQVKMQKYELYWEEHAPEDEDELKTICESAAIEIHELFKLNLINEKRGLDARIVGCIFSKIFDAIIEQLQKLEEQYTDFELDIVQRFTIGYDTNENDNDEKEGNFMIYMRDLNCEVRTEITDSLDASSLERVVSWNTQNLKDKIDMHRNIAIAALKKIADDLDIVLSSEEYIWPIFITTYEALIKYLRSRIAELQVPSLEINFISCFWAGILESEDGLGKIYIRPNINSKLKLKNDEKASSKL